MTSVAGLDVEALYVHLDKLRRAESLRWRDIATEAGVSASTFTRMGLHQQSPSADNLVKILAWLGTSDLAPYIRREPQRDHA